MSYIVCDAVTLRSHLYSESSRIVTFLTREEGLVKGIARGVRGSRNRFGAALEPLQHVRVTLSVRATRDLQTVTGADLLHPWSRIREDLFAAAYAQGVAELLVRTLWQENPGRDLYDLLLTVLQTYDDGLADPQLLFLCFGMHLADTLGYALDFTECAGCGGELTPEVSVSLAEGSARCSGCYQAPGSEPTVQRATVELLAALGRPDGPAAAASLAASRRTRREAERLMRKHLEYHTETGLELNALRLAESLGPPTRAATVQGDDPESGNRPQV